MDNETKKKPIIRRNRLPKEAYVEYKQEKRRRELERKEFLKKRDIEKKRFNAKKFIGDQLWEFLNIKK